MLSDPNVTMVSLLDSVALSATGTYYVDLAGFNSCTIVVTTLMGTATANDYFTPSLLETDSAPGTLSGYSAVGADDYIDISALAVMNATQAYKQAVSYVGGKRYVALKMTETGTAVATTASIVAILGKPKESPAVNHTPTTGTAS